MIVRAANSCEKFPKGLAKLRNNVTQQLSCCSERKSTQAAIVLKMELPEMRKENLQVILEKEGMLTITLSKNDEAILRRKAY